MSETHAPAAWVDLCENPNAVSYCFSSAPALERFLVTALDVGHYAPSEPPSLHLHGIVSQKPDRFHLLPGQPEPDSVSLSLAFYKVSDLSIEGFRGEGIGSVKIRKATNGRIEFEFQSNGMAGSGSAGQLMIESIAARSGDWRPSPGPRLFSHPNVWNSCLLLAQQKGFTVKMRGVPGSQGELWESLWNATRDDQTLLTASNPIELAGLIALYEHHHPSGRMDYWWRIDGPNLLKQFQDEWKVRYFGPDAASKHD